MILQGTNFSAHIFYYKEFLYILKNSSPFKLAPPTKTPSTDFSFEMPSIFEDFTEPPYKTLISFTPNSFATTDLMCALISYISSKEGTFPVPIAQTGS